MSAGDTPSATSTRPANQCGQTADSVRSPGVNRPRMRVGEAARDERGGQGARKTNAVERIAFLGDRGDRSVRAVRLRADRDEARAQ